jgi:nucleoid DNA-binding protein
MKMAKKKKVAKNSGAPRAANKLDLTKPVKVAASAKARTKGGFFQTIADHVGIHRRDVAGVFHVMGSMIKSDLSKAGSGVFTVPGLLRITAKRKPATKARPGINPFTKEPITIKAKPARNVVRVRPLRSLKEMV